MHGMENIKNYPVWAPITQRAQKIYDRMHWDSTFYAGGGSLLGMIMNTMNNGTEKVKTDKAKVYENGMKQAE